MCFCNVNKTFTKVPNHLCCGADGFRDPAKTWDDDAGTDEY